MAMRTETDSMGAIEVPSDRYYGAQTARSLHHFPIGDDQMPEPLIRAIGILKEASARVNADLGKLRPRRPSSSSPPPARCRTASSTSTFPSASGRRAAAPKAI